MPETPVPSPSPRSRDALERVGYLADEPAALVSFLAQRLGKPVLVEGPAGVGKTELAKALSRATGRELIRLQCYEGLDEAKALYEWNYRKQLLRIQAEAGRWRRGDRAPDGTRISATTSSARSSCSRGRCCRRSRPTEPVVLLIDEIDKTDQEFEAMLLEVLSDFQISIPELGVIEARTQPIVVLTSNNSRELTEALKRRCLYLWLDYPEVEREMEIVRLHAPELDEKLARRLVEVVHMVRALDLKKPPSIAESIDWARALLLLGADDIDREVFEQTMSIIVKHRTDIDLVAERVGVQARRRASRARRRSRRLSRPRPGRASAGLAPRLVAFCEELRSEGVAVGTSEILDAFEALGGRAVDRAAPTSARRWPRRSPSRRRTGACSSCSSTATSSAPPRPRRSSARIARSAATRAASGSTSTSCARRSARRSPTGDDGEMRDLARLAIAAFGRRGEGSGVVGVDVQRIRRTLGLQASGAPTATTASRRARPREVQASSSATCAASSSGR